MTLVGMMQSPRYVSKELTHFVGKGKTEAEQYDILANKILKTGWLTYPPHNPARPRQLSADFSQPISEDKALKYEVVCFCDIPESELAIHVSKYSKFGLAFTKRFLTGKGACPVFYVANESPTSAAEIWPPGGFMPKRVSAARAQGFIDRALYFSVSVRQLLDVFAALDAISSEEDRRFFKGGALPATESGLRLCQLFGLSDQHVSAMEQALKGNIQASKTISNLRSFLIDYVFSYVKCFDTERSFEDESNYYMEREWRVANNVNFSLDDVSRVYLPSNYARKFRADFPNYLGQLSLID
jgi:hypothetical protein